MRKRGVRSCLSVLVALGALCALVAIAPPAAAVVQDTEALAVARRLPVGRDAVDVAVNSRLGRAYVLNQETYETPGTLSVFDTATNSLLATPTVGYLPTSVAVNPRTNRIYVAAYDEAFLGIVSVLDGVSNQTVQTVRLAGHASASDLVVDETTDHVYALAVDFWECFPPEEAEEYKEAIKYKKGAKPVKCDGYVISVIDGSTGELQKDAVIQLPGNNVSKLALNPTTQRLYVLNSFSEDITVVELKKGKGKIIDPSVSVAYGPTTEWGRQPSALAVDHITNIIYTVNRSNGTIVAIDGNTHKLSSTIDHGGGTGTDIAVNPVLRRAYVSDFRSVVVIDLDTNRLVGWGPSDETFAVAVDPHTHRIYSPFKTDSSCEFFGCNYTLGVFIPVNYLPAASGPYPASERVAINPDTDRMYMVNSSTSDVSVLDTRTGTALARVPVGYAPWEAAINVRTNRIYVTSRQDATVTVIDGNTDTVVAVVPVGQDRTQWILPFGVTVNPDTNLVYTANKAEDAVSIIDGATNAHIGTIPVGDEPWDVVYDNSTNRLYVPNRLSNDVSVIDASTHKVLTTVALPPGSSPTVAGVSTAGGEVLVAGNALSVIRVSTNAVTGALPLAGMATDIAVDDASDTTYIGLGSRGVAVVRTVDHQLIAHVELHGARGVAVDPDAGRTWVVGGGGNWQVSSFTAF